MLDIPTTVCRTLNSVLLILSLTFLGVACASSGASLGGSEAVTVRLGYFPNITHATAIVGVQKGIFANALGPNVRLDTKVFNAGPAAVEAIFSDGIDATYVGSNPAINAFTRSNGEAIRIVSGATSGGASLVVKPSIKNVEDLRGKKIASPQVGNTQDVALRAWLASKGFKTNLEGAGDVSVVPQENATTLETFKAGIVDGAWAPEPWASRFVLEGGGKVLVDERDLWPSGRYVTTQLVVRTEFLRKHRDVVVALLRGQVAANDFVNRDAAQAKQIVTAAIKKITGKSLSPAVVDRAWKNLAFTNDPIATSLSKSALAARALGFITSADLTGIYDLSPLNEALREAKQPEVPG